MNKVQTRAFLQNAINEYAMTLRAVGEAKHGGDLEGSRALNRIATDMRVELERAIDIVVLGGEEAEPVILPGIMTAEEAKAELEATPATGVDPTAVKHSKQKTSIGAASRASPSIFWQTWEVIAATQGLPYHDYLDKHQKLGGIGILGTPIDNEPYHGLMHAVHQHHEARPLPPDWPKLKKLRSCPNCHTMFDKESALITDEDGGPTETTKIIEPTEGMFSMCLRCGTVIRLEEDRWRKLTPEDVAEMPPDALMQAVRATMAACELRNGALFSGFDQQRKKKTKDH